MPQWKEEGRAEPWVEAPIAQRGAGAQCCSCHGVRDPAAWPSWSHQGFAGPPGAAHGGAPCTDVLFC